MGRNGSHKKRGRKYRGGLRKFQEWMADQDSSSSESSNVPVVGGQAQARRRLVRAANSLAQLVKKDNKAKKHKKDKKAKKHRRSSSSSSSSSRSSSKGGAPKVEDKHRDRKEAGTIEEAQLPGLQSEEAKPPLPTTDDHQAWQQWPKKEESKPWPVPSKAWPKKEEKEAWPKKEEKEAWPKKEEKEAWPKKEEKPQAQAWATSWKSKASKCDVCELRSYWGRGDCVTASCPIKKENTAEQNKAHRMKAWLEQEIRRQQEGELRMLARLADEQLALRAQEVSHQQYKEM
jgi:hypothetical protein